VNRLALEAVAVAYEQLGQGEEGKNNSGPVVKKYTRGKEASWCAAFLSWCFEIACACLERQGLIIAAPERSHGAKGFSRNVAKLGVSVDLTKDYPQPGDVIAWHRGQEITWRGHTGIVFGYENETDTLYTIEGNTGDYPSKVKIKVYRNGSWRKKLYKLARMDDDIYVAASKGHTGDVEDKA
jgi:hypothetical protein